MVRLTKFRFAVLLMTFIIGVMCAIGYMAWQGLPKFHTAVLGAREEALRKDLTRMRKKIRDYTIEKGAPPQTLDDLIKANYVKGIPPDPITEQKDWNLIYGANSNSPNSAYGIIDVRSRSLAKSSEGTPYSSW